MAAKKIDIMDIRQLIQLKIRGESNRSCSSILAIHRNTVNFYVRQLKATGSGYADLLHLSDSELKELFPYRSASDSDRYEELAASFSYFKQQLHLPGGTRETLGKEYLHQHPEGYGYTQFNEHYNNWLNQTKASGKLTHKAGDKLLVDYCGKRLQLVNKSPAEWAKSLNDETLATALLDRLLYKCQLIQLQGKSYRMQNRKTIFKDQKESI